jgi:hypothetical protein
VSCEQAFYSTTMLELGELLVRTYTELSVLVYNPIIRNKMRPNIVCK